MSSTADQAIFDIHSLIHDTVAVKSVTQMYLYNIHVNTDLKCRQATHTCWRNYATKNVNYLFDLFTGRPLGKLLFSSVEQLEVEVIVANLKCGP